MREVCQGRRQTFTRIPGGMRGGSYPSQDIQELGCPQRVKIISRDETREVVVTAKCEDSVTEEQIFMPRSIWPKRGCGTRDFLHRLSPLQGKSGVHRSHGRRSEKRRRHCIESLCREEIT